MNCLCGCGRKVKSNKKYMPGHYARVKSKWYPTEKEKFNQFKEEYSFENILLINHKPPYTELFFPKLI